MATREQMLAARERRIVRFNTRLVWFGNRVRNNVNIGMVARLKATGQLLRDAIVVNISIPVEFYTVKRKVWNEEKGKWVSKNIKIVTQRSRPGEYPRADTTRLMKDIFWELRERENLVRVGTTLDYGLRLETTTSLRRGYIRRTLFERLGELGVILASPGGGPAGRLPGQDA